MPNDNINNGSAQTVLFVTIRRFSRQSNNQQRFIIQRSKRDRTIINTSA